MGVDSLSHNRYPTTVKPPSPTLQIGTHTIPNRVVVAPMAGVTDLPWRELCIELGAGMAVGEMLTSDLSLNDSRKSYFRRQSSDNAGLRSVQLVGNQPEQLAQAARFNADEGAQVIDINMGCPAKKVCKKAAGSALLADPDHVARLLDAVVAAVDLPVTLKMRTGISREQRNGVTIAKIAEQAGVQMLAVHGRTRADRFDGRAEYDTIKAIAAAVSIPVLANGDITSPAMAQQVLADTGAAGVMIGRGSQGRPWLPGVIARALNDEPLNTPTPKEQSAIMGRHLLALHDFYGDYAGVRIARKHIGWFINALPNHPAMTATITAWKTSFNRLECARDQEAAYQWFAAYLAEHATPHLPAPLATLTPTPVATTVRVANAMPVPVNGAKAPDAQQGFAA